MRTSEIGLFLDSYLLLIMGGIPWQVGYRTKHKRRERRECGECDEGFDISSSRKIRV